VQIYTFNVLALRKQSYATADVLRWFGFCSLSLVQVQGLRKVFLLMEVLCLLPTTGYKDIVCQMTTPQLCEG
jgi:hypothetical protein